MLYHVWTCRYVTCFTMYEQVCMLHALPCMNKCVCDSFSIYGLVGMWHALPFINKCVCGMVYHVWTSRYVTCFTMHEQVRI